MTSRLLPLALLTSLCACSADPTTNEPPLTPKPTARLRAVHLSPNAPAVDVIVDGVPAAQQLTFSTTSALRTVAADASELEVGPVTAPLSLEADTAYTAVVFGKLERLAVNVLEDDRRALATNNVRVRVIHAADGVGTVNVLQVRPDAAAVTLVSNLRFGVASPALDLPSEELVVGLDVDADLAADLSFEVPALPRGTLVNVFAALDAAGAPFLLAQLEGAPAVRLDPVRSQLRVLHLSPGTPPVEAFVDGAAPSPFARIAFGELTATAPFTSGAHRLDVSATTVAMPALTVNPIRLAPARTYTAVAYGLPTALAGLLLEDGVAESGKVAVRAIHAAPSVGRVDLYSVGGTGALTPLVSDVDFGDASGVLQLPPGSYTVGVDVNDDANLELAFQLPALGAGAAANVFVTQDAAGAVFALVQLADGTVARIEPASARLRVVHLSRNAPSVDVYANQARVVSGLAYGNGSAALTVRSGVYTVDVTPANGTAVVLSAAVTLLPGKAYTAYAYGDIGDPGRPLALGLIEDDAGGLATSTDVRLRVTHAATTVTRGDLFAVRPAGNLLLVPDIGFGETKARLDLASNAYTVGFDAEANGTIDLAFDLPVLAPGSLANVFVTTDPQGQVCLLVQTVAAGVLRVNPR